MATLSLRLPDSLHRHLKSLAKEENVSVNQLIGTAVAEKMAALMTESYLGELAKGGSRGDFERVLAQVPDSEPDPWDRWSSDHEKA